MNSTDFGYQHFMLIKAPYALVLEALKAETTDANADDQGFEMEPWTPGLLTRFLLKFTPLGKSLNRGMEAQHAMQELAGSATIPEVAPYAVVSGPDAQTPPLLTIDDIAAHHAGSDTSVDDIRLRGIGSSDWVLVEYKEQVSGMSMLGYSLSVALHNTDVLYFCRSGDVALEKRYDFHVYQNGATLRRVLCHSTHPQGQVDQEWWEGIVDGNTTAYEAADLYAGATEETVLNNAKLDAILAQVGLKLDSIFAQSADTVLFTRQG